MTTIYLNSVWTPLTLDLDKTFIVTNVSCDTLTICDNANKLNPAYFNKGEKVKLKGMSTPYYLLGKGRVDYTEWSEGSGDTSSLAQESTLENIESDVANIASTMGASALVWKSVINKQASIYNELSPIEYAVKGDKIYLRGVFEFIVDRTSILSDPVILFTIPDPTVRDTSTIQEDSQYKYYIDNSGNFTDELFLNSFEKSDRISMDNLIFYL